jgi:DNA polymerase IV (DinB-like DNA polymerase)
MIGHVDLDYFYAQVEEVENPSLKELPVVVCVYSGRTEDSGVVSTANYKARELGVRSGIPIITAKKRLEGKDGKFIAIDHEKYETYSDRIMEIVRENVDILEQTGIDEAFFDITTKSGEDFGLATQIATQIKRDILQREKLTCSIGIAPNKVVAKLASDFEKPDGLTVVLPSNLSEFLRPVPIEDLYGVGPKSAKALREAGVDTVGELGRVDLDTLFGLFARSFAIYLHDAALGIDESRVVETSAVTQISRIITLKRNSHDFEEIMTQLSPVIDDVQRKAAEKELLFRSVSVIGILTNLSIKTRSKTLEAPTDDLARLKKAIHELLGELLKEPLELRRTGVRVSDFSETKSQQSLNEFLA